MRNRSLEINEKSDALAGSTCIEALILAVIVREQKPIDRCPIEKMWYCIPWCNTILNRNSASLSSIQPEALERLNFELSTLPGQLYGLGVVLHIWSTPQVKINVFHIPDPDKDTERPHVSAVVGLNVLLVFFSGGFL